jgi:hypothetical protein
MTNYAHVTNDCYPSADPDPIWICEELALCTINDNAKANMTALTVSPKSGQQGKNRL